MRRVVLTIIIGSVLLASSGWAETIWNGESIYNLNPSVRSLGMGGSGVAMADQGGVYINPATLGLSDFDLISMSYIVTPSTKYSNFIESNTNIYGNPVTYDKGSTRSGLVAVNLTRLANESSPNLSVVVAFGRSHDLSYSIIGTPDSSVTRNYVDQYSVSLSFGKNYKASIGYSFKNLVSIYNGNEQSKKIPDFGFLVEVPLDGTIDDHADCDGVCSKFRLGVSSRIDIEDKGYYPQSPSSDLLTYVGAMLSLTKLRAGKVLWEAAFSFGQQTSSQYVISWNYNNYDRYYTTVNDLNFGLELGVRQALYARLGSFKINDERVKTLGLGFSPLGLRGGKSREKSGEKKPTGNFLSNLRNNLNLRIDYAHIFEPGSSRLEGADFFGLTLSM